MSTPAPPPDPTNARLPYMTGYEHFVLNVKPRIKLSNPDMDSAEIVTKCAELWYNLVPCEKTYWNKIASNNWDKYTRGIMNLLNEHPQHASYAKTPHVVHCKHCKCSVAHYLTTQGATPQGATTQGATPEGATAQGATVQGATTQGTMAKGATTQGATAQGATTQGAMAKGATPEGATTQGATAQGATTQGATAQGATTQCATAQRATAQRAMAQGYRCQEAAAQGYWGQGVTAPGYWVQGATAQGFWVQAVPAQGYGTLGVRVQNYRAPDEMAATPGVTQNGRRAVHPPVYPTYKIDMEAGTSYKSYLYYGDDPKPEVRRFFLTDLESYLFEPLQAQVCAMYKLKTQKFSIAWKDEDGDEVVMSSDAEVRTMLSEGQEGVIKLVVRCENDVSAQTFPAANEASAATNPGEIPAAVHTGVTCDGCENTVVGHRYKCISCDNFDLCAKCETEGKHSHHCVVRVPHPNMPVPLLKATIKRSRRFLKSVMSNAVEENKNLRRERKHSSEPKTQGKQDFQPRTSITWMEIFNKYLDDFSNIAGNMAYAPEKETRTTEAATSTEPRSGEAAMNVPTGDQIDLNPWELDVIDLSRLQRACKYMRENKTTKDAFKIFGALDSGHAFTQMDSKKVASNLTQGEKDIAEAGPAPRQEVIKPEAKPKPQESAKTYQGVGQPELAPSQAALSDSAKMAQITTTGEAGLESNDIDDKQGDNSELVNAINKCEVSSNASSFSEGNGSEKADGWTIIDAILSMKESADSPDVEVGPMEGQEPIRQAPGLYPPLNTGENPEPLAYEGEGPMECLEPRRQQAPLYPPLNAATAVLNTKASDTAASAPAAAPASAAAKQTENAEKKTTPDTSEDLRGQLAPHVEAALQQMESMGFTNESGWLSQLLVHHDGNIAIVLDLIDAPNAVR